MEPIFTPVKANPLARSGGFSGKLTHSYEPPYSSDVESNRPFWVEISKMELETLASESGLVVQAMIPLKHFSENFIFGYALGSNGRKAFLKELRDRLLADQAVQEFYDWLELELFQKLPFQATHLTLVILEKTVNLTE